MAAKVSIFFTTIHYYNVKLVGANLTLKTLITPEIQQVNTVY